MVCCKCGKQLEEGSMFCTECGRSIGSDEKIKNSDNKVSENKYVKKTNNFIERFGEVKINKYLSIIAIFFMLAIRVFGYILTAIVITVVNGYLVYCNYKKASKADLKMIIWSVAVLLAGLLIWLQIRTMLI